MIAKVPASNDAQYCHVDHSVLPLVAERASVFYVGQYSMQITASGGSDLGANQHGTRTFLNGASPAKGSVRAEPRGEIPHATPWVGSVFP